MSRTNKSIDNELQKQGKGKQHQKHAVEMEQVSAPIVSKIRKSVKVLVRRSKGNDEKEKIKKKKMKMLLLFPHTRRRNSLPKRKNKWKKDASAPVVSNKPKSVQVSSSEKETKRKHQDEDAPPVTPRKKKKLPTKEKTQMKKSSAPVVSKKPKSVQVSSSEKDMKRKHQDEDAPPVTPQKKKKHLFDHEEKKESVSKANGAAAAENRRSMIKKPGGLFTHEDSIKILEAALVWSEDGTLTDREKFYAHVEGQLSKPDINSDQAYGKMCKLRKRYQNWVRRGEHTFTDPLEQELHDLCEKIWAVMFNLSGVAMAAVSEELLTRLYWTLGWSYTKPQ